MPSRIYDYPRSFLQFTTDHSEHTPRLQLEAIRILFSPLLIPATRSVGRQLSIAALLFLLAASLNAQTYMFTKLAGVAGRGPGSTDGMGSAFRFADPYGVAVDGAGNLYVVDTQNSTILKITPGGVVTTLAGTAGVSGSADGTGGAGRFNEPTGVAVDGAGNVYVADTGNFTIRKITSGGVVTTLAGTAGASGSADGTGSVARFYNPLGVAVDGAGTVYVADTYNDTIRKITPGGVVTTLAGTAEGWEHGRGREHRPI